MKNVIELTPEYIDYNMFPLKEKIEGEPMTIIIGALADGGNSLIAMADKLTTAGGLSENISKIRQISKKTVVLTSGFVQNYLFLDEAKKEIENIENIKQLTEKIAEYYLNYRLGKIQREILPLYGLRSIEDYLLKQKNMVEFVVGSLTEQIKNLNIYVDFIVAGIDEIGHVFHVGHPGTYACFDANGYICMGAGALCSLPVFEYLKYDKTLPLEEVKKICFCAKKRSEKMGGIGEDTEIIAITNDGIMIESETDLKKIKDSYEKIKKENQLFF